MATVRKAKKSKLQPGMGAVPHAKGVTFASGPIAEQLY